MILILLATMGFFFLSFQMFSVHLLSQEHRRTNFLWGSSRRRRNGAGTGIAPGKDGVVDLLSNGHERDPEQIGHLQNQFLEKYLNDLKREEGYEEMASLRGDASQSPDTWWSPQFIGVAPHRLGLYQAALESDVFTCVSRPERRLAFSQVNDDYCDCEEDGSDEPGTEACATLAFPSRRQSPSSPSAGEPVLPPVIARRFFCRFQLPGAVSVFASHAAHDADLDYDGAHLQTIPLQWTPHSRVNDGICDCCDGSDEWRNTSTSTASSAMAAVAQLAATQRRVPCANTCVSVVTNFKERLIAQREGKSLKAKYILEAKRHFR